jgi:hypothetical protein
MRYEYIIKEELYQAQQRLSELTRVVVNEGTYDMDLTGGDGRYERSERTVGTKEEIKAQMEKIARLEEELRERQKFDAEKPTRDAENKKETEAKKQRDKEARAKEREEQRRLEQEKVRTFKKVKEQYKKLNFFDRVLNKLNGHSPNWKNVQKLSKEELEFLIKVGSGKASFQEKYESEHRYVHGKAEQERWDRRVNDMTSCMRRTDYRQRMMQDDEKEHGYGRGY